MSNRVAVHPFGRAGVFAQRPGWYRNNAGWIHGDGRTLLVDTCATEALTRELLSRSAMSCPHPAAPMVLALTHAHGDHSNGAGFVESRGAVVYATRSAAAEIGRGIRAADAYRVFDDREVSWGQICAPVHVTPIAERTVLDLGGVAAELYPAPRPAHSDGDMIVWEAEQGLLFAGDLLFHQSVPLLHAGPLSGLVEALEWLRGFDAATIVPGHGTIPEDGDRALVDLLDYLRWLLDAAEPKSVDFASLTEQARTKWSTWSEGERHPVNVRAAHAEVHGYEMNEDDAAREMMAINGGPILLEL